MSPDRWGQIQDVYHATLERQPSQREEFLSRACSNDAELRHEVESLLRHEGEADGLLESPAWNHVRPNETSSSALPEMAPGTQLGVYRIVELIGAGGMGEVYRARDTRLGRDVALKILPAELAQDPSRRARFEQEARVVAALNHPNIVAIYDVGERYLVTELVDGEPLRGAKLGVRRAIDVAAQIAAGLAAAHDAGVVHRDLKPDNILVTRDGRLKILDFGLAKVLRAADAETATEMTEPGMVLGTVGYMSPEQVRGAVTDHRSDIFSFGLILYELLAGKRAFCGDTPAEVMTAILKQDAPEVPESAPEWLRQIVAHCLEKEAANRFQSAKDLGFALRQSGTQIGTYQPEPKASWRRWSMPAAVWALAVCLAAVAFLHFREKLAFSAARVRFQIPAPEGAAPGLSLSPDGRNLAFRVGGRLWVHSLESGESHDLSAEAQGATFWSQDSRFIGYPSNGKLKKIEVTGGPTQTVADLRTNLWGCGAWNQDGVIVFGERSLGLFRVPASGGVPVQITALDPARHEYAQFCPSFLPDGRHFVYVSASSEEGKSAIYLGSVDEKPEQQSSKPLVASNSQPVYAPSADASTGYLLFVREGTLMAQSFDNRRLEVKGQAVPVAEHFSDHNVGAEFVPFSASANDVLAFRRNDTWQLTWYDREGKAMETVGGPGRYGFLRLSPDGIRLAADGDSGRAAGGNISLLDLSRGGASTRFTFGSNDDSNAAWSPDGTRIVFSSNRDGLYDLYQKLANGEKGEEVLLRSSEDKFATSWSRSGRFLLYTAVHPRTKSDIWVLPMEGDRKPVPFLATEYEESRARFSPDGHWVSYTSNESGHDEVFVRSFFMNSAGTAVESAGKWLISNGLDSRWRGDGRELFYRLRDHQLMAVEIATDPAFRAGIPQPLGILPSQDWDSSADGSRFLSVANTGGPQVFTVVLNWQSGLKK